MKIGQCADLFAIDRRPRAGESRSGDKFARESYRRGRAF